MSESESACVCVFSVSGLPSTPIHSFGVYFFAAAIVVVATVTVAVAAQCVCTVVTAAI